MDDVIDDVCDYVIDFDVSDDVIDFDVDVADFDFSDVGDFDVISTDELTTMLPFDNVTCNVAFSSFFHRISVLFSPSTWLISHLTNLETEHSKSTSLPNF